MLSAVQDSSPKEPLHSGHSHCSCTGDHSSETSSCDGYTSICCALAMYSCLSSCLKAGVPSQLVNLLAWLAQNIIVLVLLCSWFTSTVIALNIVQVRHNLSRTNMAVQAYCILSWPVFEQYTHECIWSSAEQLSANMHVPPVLLLSILAASRNLPPEYCRFIPNLAYRKLPHAVVHVQHHVPGVLHASPQRHPNPTHQAYL